MSKRKRNDAEDKDYVEIEDQALRIRVARLKAKVDQGSNSITTALKLARGFERQKLGRREKVAQQKPKELLKLREEVIVLKSLDLAATAKKYLIKQLVKTKRIRESQAFVMRYGENQEIERPKSGAEANVVARLFSSSPVREVMPGIMSSIYKCLGIQERPPNGDATQKQGAAPKTKPVLQKESEGDFEGFSEPEKDFRLGSSLTVFGPSKEEDNSEDDAFGEYVDRLALSSDELEEALKIDQAPRRLPEHFVNGQNHDRSASDQPSTSHSPSISDSDASVTPPPKTRSTKSALPKTSGTSFLPSLSLGGYYSGSESDEVIDDRRFDIASGLPQVRNNRRGQRARQKIAERKYGKNAKHLTDQNKYFAAGRDLGWDAKRGATDAKGKFGKSRFRRKERGPTGANAGAVKAKSSTVKSDGPLHPSWEAAKKRKEEQKPSLAFSGKKIKFD